MLLSRIRVILYVIILLILSSCDFEDNESQKKNIQYDLYEIKTNYHTEDNGIYHVETLGNVNLNYTLDLGTSTKDVYFIFTNTNLETSSTLANIYEQKSVTKNETSAFDSSNLSNNALIRGKPEINEFNENPQMHLPGRTTGSQSALIPYKATTNISDTVGDGQSFIIDKNTSVYAICACKVTDSTNSRTLNIWVADDCWAETPGEKKTFVVNEFMVNQLAEKFLNEGADNDIYDWVTGIFGVEWGTWTIESYDAKLIPPDNNITILLFDIDNDDSKFLTSKTGICTGYYWAKDNYLASVASYSNQRIMFYADAVVFACPSPANMSLPDPYINWNIYDHYPAEIVFTMGHELQHMIHFYQKNILRTDGAGSDIWINEMCSLITEDFITAKLGALYKGPRGISGDTANAASRGIFSGRFPCYVYYNDSSLVQFNVLNPLPSYANSYSFAAYLARNFGGANFFRDIVLNKYTNEESINYAMQQQTNGIDITRALQQWAVSVILSDTIYDMNSPGIYDGYILNNGNNWFLSNIDGHEYRLGSVNIYNYNYLSGLQVIVFDDVIYNIYENDYCGPLPAGANRIVLAANDLTGIKSWNIILNENTSLTVVCK